MHLVVVEVALVTVHRGQVAHVEVAAKTIALGIVRLSCHTPRALGIDFTGEGQVEMLAKGQIVPAIAKIEAPVIVLAHRGHQNAALIFLTEGEVAEWHCDGQRQVLQHHIGRAGDYVFLGTHLGLGELEIEMGVLVVVASGVDAVAQVILVVGHLLGDAAG